MTCGVFSKLHLLSLCLFAFDFIKILMFLVKWRFVIAAMVSLTGIFNFIVRGNMSINILAMTEPLYNNSDPVPDYGPRYKWSSYDQGLVLGSYAWGTVIITFFAGVFAEKFGPRKVIGYAMICGAILTALAPVAANFLWLSILIRLLTGISMGAISPSLQAVIANWAPLEEKGKFLSLTMATGLGTVIDWTMSGYIIEDLGWHYAFYIVAVILGIHIILWYFIVYDTPMNHPRISTTEREFIISKLGSTIVTKKKPWPPLKPIFLSVQVWALVIFHYGYVFAQYIFLTATPKYLSEVHHFAIGETGVLSSIPYLAKFLFAIVCGFLSDYLFNKKILSAGAARRLFSVFSHFIPAFFLIGLAFVGDRPYVAVALMTVALGVCGAQTVTTVQNAHDLAPNFAATIYAISNTFGSTSGFVAPIMVAHFTKDRSTDAEWRNIFLIGSGLLIGSALIFIVFGSGKAQKWNEIAEEIEETKQENDLSGAADDDIKSKIPI